MFGVLAPPRSVFINEKAFRLCHPPQLSGTGGVSWETVVDEDGYELGDDRPDRAKVERKNPRRNSELPDLHQTSGSLARGRSYSVTEATSRTTTQAWNMTTAQVFAPLSSTSRLNSSVQMLQHNPMPEEPSNSVNLAGSSSRNRSVSGSALTRMLKFGSSSSSSSNAGPLIQPQSPSEGTSASGSRSRNWLRRIGSRDSQEGRSSDDQQRNSQGGLQEVSEDGLRGGNVLDGLPLPLTATNTTEYGRENASGLNGVRHKDTKIQRIGSGIDSLPYSIMTHPCPAPSHALYPNYTPRGQAADLSDETFPLDPILPTTGKTREEGIYEDGKQRVGSRHGHDRGHGADTRQYHPILRERKWLQGVVKDGGKVVPSEWVRSQDQGQAGEGGRGGEALTWVGPVL
jgi:hypothetical protein